MRIAAISLISILALVSCGEKPPPEGPFILTDRSSLGWGAEFASAVYVDTQPTQSLSVENKGLKDLEITEITKSGDAEFSYRLIGPLPTPTEPVIVKPLKTTFIEFIFSPHAAIRYYGEVRIKSNADNVKDLPIGLYGCAVVKNPDGGMNQGPADGGC